MGTLHIRTSSFLFVFITILNIVVVTCQYDKFSKLELPQGVIGPGSVAFRGLLFTEGPFTVVSDGRILKWQDLNTGFVDFAYTSPIRSKQFCDGTTDPDKGPICGKPLGLSFQPITGLLYIVDAYFGLLVVGPTGGLATQLASGFKFLNGVDVDPITGNVYFTDASSTYEIRNSTQPGFMDDSTGKLLRYNPLTRRVSILLGGLSGAGGPAVSSDGTFVLLSELVGNRILKYWLVGPKANTVEVLLNNITNPVKVKRAERFGEFWVALSGGIIYQLPPLITPQGVRFNSNGVVLQTISFATQYFNKAITEVVEKNRNLYVGSINTNFIGVYAN